MNKAASAEFWFFSRRSLVGDGLIARYLLGSFGVGGHNSAERIRFFLIVAISNRLSDIDVPKNAVWERVKEPEKGSQKGRAK